MSYILTLQIDAVSQAHFDELRRRYFPPERNLIDAHITLFHTLPEERGVLDELAAAAKDTRSFSVAVTGLRSLGKGVAYTLEAPPLQVLHRRLAGAFADHLSAQDRQRFMPHIVVQNKTTAEAARLSLEQLRAGFVARQVEAIGLSLWHYRGGPWEHAESLPFPSA